MEIKPASIMVIEDSLADQFLIAAAIKDYHPDTEIITAYDGLEALEKLQGLQSAPDLIFLDLNMPRMNGFEFLDAYHAQADEGCANIAVLTSSLREEDRQKALSYRCVRDYLSKPLKGIYFKRLMQS